MFHILFPTQPRFLCETGLRGLSAHLRGAGSACYGKRMCKPFRDYLSIMRDYTREIITFGGLCLMCCVYGDFRQLAQSQASTAASTVDVLRSLDSRLGIIEQHTLAK